MAVSSFKDRRTPGVYITELEAFPRSVVGVATAVPAFIGYTEKAERSGKPIFQKAVFIQSLADYEEIFGGAYEPKYNIEEVTDDAKIAAGDYDFKVVDSTDPAAPVTTYYNLVQTDASKFYLYNSLRLFYANGGGPCYIVSTGSYTEGKTPKLNAFYDSGTNTGGLNVIKDVNGPTMLLVPDALIFSETDKTNFTTIITEMTKQSKELQDRVAVLDVYNGYTTEYTPEGGGDPINTIEQFRAGVGKDNLSYGMVYFPWLNTSVIQASEIDYTNIDEASNALLITNLKTSAKELYGKDPDRLALVEAEIDKLVMPPVAPLTPEQIIENNQTVIASVPLLQDIENVIRFKLNVLPPSGAMAGVYTDVDSNRGVWKAPANVVLGSVVSPAVFITDQEQANMNVPVNGKAVNAIRDFAGEGNVVWGARTLDGNSKDYRYINVRRTLIYIEQSVKNASKGYVFEPNDANTWVAVKAMIDGFLTNVWERGGLMGDKASDAFEVNVGLGSTMTPNDVLDGYMIVQILLQMLRPAEFIELTFKQKMGK